MAIQTKICAGCDQQFDGRPNARACSPRCRKRLFRARQAITHEVEKLAQLRHELKQDIQSSLATPQNEIGAIGQISQDPAIGVGQNMPQAATPVQPLTGQPVQAPSPQMAGGGTGQADFASFQPQETVLPQYQPTAVPAEPQMDTQNGYNQSPPVTSLGTRPTTEQWEQLQDSWQTAPTETTLLNTNQPHPMVSGGDSLPNVVIPEEPEVTSGSRIGDLFRRRPVAISIVFIMLISLASGGFAITGLLRQDSAQQATDFSSQEDSTDSTVLNFVDARLTINFDTTIEAKLGIGMVPIGDASLQVAGDIQSTATLFASGGESSLNNDGLTIDNVTVCTSAGCIADNLPATPDSVLLQNAAPGTQQTGSLHISGTATAGSFSGSGSALTSLNASNISSGTLSDARLSSNISLLGQTIDSSEILDGTIVNLDIASTAAIAYAKLNLASSITNADVSSSAAIAYSKLSLANSVTNADLAGSISDTKLLTISTAGKVADTALSSNVALLDRSPQTFTGNNTFTGTLLHQNATDSTAAFRIQNASGSALLNANTTHGQVSVNQIASSYSDEFGSGTRPSWSFVAGDASTYDINTTTVGKLYIDPNPDGGSHDCWAAVDTCLRLVQAPPAGDFQAETKIDTTPGSASQAVGLLFWQDASNLIRFEYDGDQKVRAHKVIAGVGTANLVESNALGAAPIYIRVNRVGNTWLFSHSTNGTAWTSLGSATQALDLSVANAKIGIALFNTLGSFASANVDYFRLTVPNVKAGQVSFTQSDVNAGTANSASALAVQDANGTALLVADTAAFQVNVGAPAGLAAFNLYGNGLVKTTSTTAFQVQNAAGNELLLVNTTGSLVALGKASTLTGNLTFYNAAGAGNISLQGANPGAGTFTITLPAATGTVCLTSGNCAGVGGTGDILNGGNTTGAAITIGTNDAFGLNLETGGTTVASFTSGGAALFKNSADSATAFQVQNLAGDNFLLADTTGNILGLCSSASCDTLNLATNADADTINIGDSLDTLTLTGAAGSTIVLNGTTISAAELNLLDGHDVALVDTNDAVATAITGTGALSAGSLAAGFTTVAVGQGGTGATTFTANGVLYGNTTGAIQVTAAGTTGQCLIGNTGAAPTWTTCTGLVTLQNAYANGNSITTTDARDIDLVLADTATDSNLDIQVATGSTGYIAIARADGAGAADPAQLLLIDNLDTDRAQPIGLKLQSAAGALTTAIDATDAEIVTALAIGSNTITTTTTTIAATELDLLDGHDVALVDTNDAVATAITGTGALSAGSITSGFGTIDNADTITGTTLNGTTGINTGAVAGTQRIDSSGNLVNIGNITGAGAVVLQPAAASALTITAHAASTWSTDSGNLTLDSVANLNLGTTNATGVTLGNTTNTTAIALQGAAAATYTIGDTNTTGTTTLGRSTDTNIINIGNANTADTKTQTINIGAGTGVTSGKSAVTVGSTANASSLLLQAGIGNLQIQTQGGTLGIGNNAVEQTLSIGNGTGATAVSVLCGTGTCGFGNNAVDHSTTVGSATGTSLTTLQSGSGGITLQAAGTGAIDVIQIGVGGAGSTTPDYLALDVKSDTGDPAGGAEGYIYYNTFDNKFRCYQNAAWTDCVSAGATVTLQDAYGNDANDDDTIISQTSADDGLIFRNPDSGGSDSTYILTLDQLEDDTGTHGGLSIQSAGTGNLLLITDTTATARDVMTIADGGATTFRNQTDSTSAFSVQAAGGGKLLVADSTNSRLYVGDPTADGTGILLVLDIKNTTADPTGVDGGIYYNSAYHIFRCYRDGAWADCSVPAIDRGYEFTEDFLGGGITNGTIGTNGWAVNQISGNGCDGANGRNVAYNVTMSQDADRPGIIRCRLSTTANSGALVQAHGDLPGYEIEADTTVKMAAAISAASSGFKMYVGMAPGAGNSNRPVSGVWFEADVATNANWLYCYGDGSAGQCTSTAVAVAASTWVRFEVRVTATGAGTSAATFYLNGSSFSVSSATIDTTTKVQPWLMCYHTGVTANQDCYLDYMQVRGIASGVR